MKNVNVNELLLETLCGMYCGATMGALTRSETWMTIGAILGAVSWLYMYLRDKRKESRQ